MAQKNEERISTKILFFEKPIDMQKWNLAVKDNAKKIKKNESDDFDTEFVDVDWLFSRYLGVFRRRKKELRTTIKKNFISGL